MRRTLPKSSSRPGNGPKPANRPRSRLPLVPELKELFPDAPYIAHPGNISNLRLTFSVRNYHLPRRDRQDHLGTERPQRGDSTL